MAQILELPEMQRGHPLVLAGAASLRRRVRWVHVLEVRDIEGLLLGGELVLTTGVGLPNEGDAIRAYVSALHEAHVSGVVLQLGDRWREAPRALVNAAEAHGLPLVALRTRVPFVAITEAVHVSIVSAQLAELRASQRLHDVFTRLGLSAASADDIVREAADLAGAPVVLENLNHRVLAAATAGRDREQVLLDWERRSRHARDDGSTTVAGSEGWLVTPVGTGGDPWGRLVMVGSGEPSRLQEMALERAAEALVLRRLIAADRSAFEREASKGLVDDVRGARYRSTQEMAVRLRAAGMPVLGRRLQAVIVMLDPEQGPSTAPADAVERLLNRAGARALVTPSAVGIAALIAWDDSADPVARLTSVALALRASTRRVDPKARATVAAGRLVGGIDEVPTSFREAEQVAAATPHNVGGDDKPVVSLRDLGIRGLIATLRDDPRLQLFVEDSIGPLLDRTSASPSRRELLDALGAYLAERGNKSSAAARLHMSRPAFYSRLDVIENLLGIDLEDAQSVLAVHFALVARDVLTPRVG
jgi:purine catabolism regulator